MIDAGLARTTINQRVGRIVRLFKWAASEELVPAGVYQALKAVSGLPKGRSEARETEPVRPVPDDVVEAIRPHVARQVWAMVELQRLTGMRPGEVVIMRTCDLDTSGEVWVYTPAAAQDGAPRPGADDLPRPPGPGGPQALAPAGPDGVPVQPAGGDGGVPGRAAATPQDAAVPLAAARTRKPDPKHAPGRAVHDADLPPRRRVRLPAGGRPAVAPEPAAAHRGDADPPVRSAWTRRGRCSGHSDLKTSEIYAERDREQAARVMREIG